MWPGIDQLGGALCVSLKMIATNALNVKVSTSEKHVLSRFWVIGYLCAVEVLMFMYAVAVLVWLTIISAYRSNSATQKRNICECEYEISSNAILSYNVGIGIGYMRLRLCMGWLFRHARTHPNT